LACLKISIITAAYNSATTIGHTIDSVAKQTHVDIEHLIVDGASRDSTMEIVKAASSVSRFISEPDNGIYDAMNKGIKMATGEIVGILNSDDFYADDSVLAQVSEVFSDPSVDACYADLLYVSQQDTSKVIRYWKSKDFQPGLFKKGWMPAHPTFFVRKSVYDELGDFDLSYKLQADFELTMRFLEVYRVNAVYVPHIWVKMRMGGASNQIINVIKGNIEAYKACKKNHIPVSIGFNLVKVLSRVPQFFRRPA
jgi:glycosyltransferase involved in cell wall biosynthesis